MQAYKNQSYQYGVKWKKIHNIYIYLEKTLKHLKNLQISKKKIGNTYFKKWVENMKRYFTIRYQRAGI